MDCREAVFDVHGAAETVTPRPETTGDELLRAARRVDWRFLLPEPELGNVAYVGAGGEKLCESLRLFSHQLCVIPGQHGPACGPFDLVVTCDPSYERLRRAADLVGSGRYLYVEAHRKWWPRLAQRSKAGRLRCAADYVAAIQRLGFVAVQAHWHWPDFESCVEIVRLGDPEAWHYALAHRRGGRLRRFQSACVRWLLRFGLGGRIVSCFSVVARKQGDEGA